MLKLTCFASNGAQASDTLTLPFDERQRSRFLAQLDSGREVGVVLARGSVLRNGDCLLGDEGLVVRVRAAREAVSIVRIDDEGLLARIGHQLGSRRVPLQIGTGEIRYPYDHLLNELLRSMGLEVREETAPFTPEPAPPTVVETPPYRKPSNWVGLSTMGRLGASARHRAGFPGSAQRL
ncbi:urease accessory protein UreE [Methylolobus aquaticus]